MTTTEPLGTNGSPTPILESGNPIGNVYENVDNVANVPSLPPGFELYNELPTDDDVSKSPFPISSYFYQ